MPSLSGRLAHVFSTRLGPLSRWYGHRHARAYAASHGQRRTKILSGNDVFCLTVPGRTSGEPRSVMLVLVRDGDDVLCCASNAGHPTEPDWSLNLRAAGRAEVQVGSHRWAVEAREAAEDDRQRLWVLLVAEYPDFESYQELSTRRLPIWVLAPGD